MSVGSPKKMLVLAAKGLEKATTASITEIKESQFMWGSDSRDGSKRVFLEGDSLSTCRMTQYSLTST